MKNQQLRTQLERELFLQTFAAFCEDEEMTMGESAMAALSLICPETYVVEAKRKDSPYKGDEHLPAFFKRVWGIKFRFEEQD